MKTWIAIAALSVYIIAFVLTIVCYTRPKTSSECGVFEDDISSLVLNGTVTPLNFAPWYVALKRKSTRDPKCGGTILSPNWVLTAKHCFSGSQDALDDSYGTVHEIIDVKTYDNISVYTDNDIALLKVSPKIRFRKSGLEGYKRGIAPVCLPKKDEAITEKEAISTGFGITDEFYKLFAPYLMSVKLKMYPLEFCSMVEFRDETSLNYIKNTHICAGNIEERKAICNGDSGGPLTVIRRNLATLIGVVTAGSEVGCEKIGYYMDVTKFMPWITCVTGLE